MKVEYRQQLALRLNALLQVLEMKEIEETKPSTSSGKLLHGSRTCPVVCDTVVRIAS